MKRALALAALMLATGCSTYSLEKLRHTTPSGTPFQTALSKLYMQFAAQEEKDYDWLDSWHFADKGLALAYGHDQKPEEIADWDIPASVRPDMEKARARLMEYLTAELEDKEPDITARAQYHFDCWMEQQEENWQEDDIAACREGLYDDLEALQLAKLRMDRKERDIIAATQEPAPVRHVKKHAKAAVKPASASAADSLTYVVFFAPGSAELNAAGKKSVDEILRALESSPAYAVTLRHETAKGNAALTKAREEALKKRLESGGIPASHIHTSGEVPANLRKVDIFING